jgi:hypothetical protein
MLKVYFDKNVLSHIISAQRGAPETNGVSFGDVKALLNAVAAGKIVNLLSVIHLQEASYALRASSPSVARDELRLIKQLMNTREIIKFPSDLLKDDITAYANGRELSFPLMPNPLNLDELFSPDGDIAERRKVLNDTDQSNSDFLIVTSDAKKNDREYVLNEFAGRKPAFEEFYQKKMYERIVGTVRQAEEETGREGLLEACKKRGIEGMLKIPSVALAEGISLSYQYARIFEEMSEKKRKRLGDPGDLNHALLASAADILVTHDRDFATWVDRILNKPFQVFDHVHKLILHLA